MRLDKKYQLTDEETVLNRRLAGYMVNYIEQTDYIIRVDYDPNLSLDLPYDTDENPNEAPRIDIRLSGGWRQSDKYYGVEAKIVVGSSWKTRNPSKLNRRYIRTGIDHFKNGDYARKMDRGCIVAYLVQGNATTIVNAINGLLMKDKRNNEMISGQHSINGYSLCYLSTHVRKTDSIQFCIIHLFLDLT